MLVTVSCIVTKFTAKSIYDPNLNLIENDFKRTLWNCFQSVHSEFQYVQFDSVCKINLIILQTVFY